MGQNMGQTCVRVPIEHRSPRSRPTGLRYLHCFPPARPAVPSVRRVQRPPPRTPTNTFERSALERSPANAQLTSARHRNNMIGSKLRLRLEPITHICAELGRVYAPLGPRVIGWVGVDRGQPRQSGEGSLSARISTPAVREWRWRHACSDSAQMSGAVVSGVVRYSRPPRGSICL